MYGRDTGKNIRGFSMATIAYIKEYVDDDGYLDASLLPEPLQKFYRWLR